MPWADRGLQMTPETFLSGADREGTRTQSQGSSWVEILCLSDFALRVMSSRSQSSLSKQVDSSLTVGEPL